ncbi:MAG TPA: hypothetical protein DCL77_14290 [Prolixibacteraceae bacterium]|jgi:hypothetical protein|nr:hypothetical protein [Prolixibacteraceae bacterium]
MEQQQTALEKQIETIKKLRDTLLRDKANLTHKINTRNGLFGDTEATNDLFSGEGFNVAAGRKMIADIDTMLITVNETLLALTDKLPAILSTAQKENAGQQKIFSL